MADAEQWSTDANSAVKLRIVQPGDERPKTLSTFNPQFTYPIFGNSEEIFGYQGLSVEIRFAAHDLRPNVQSTWDRKYTTVGDTEAVDINKILKGFLPESSFGQLAEYEGSIQDDASAKDFKPPGKMMNSYRSKGKNYEIWCGTLSDPAVKKIISNMQILISFFIEGGQPLKLDEEEWTLERWSVFFVYEILPASSISPLASPYCLAGYSTTYRFWAFSPAAPKGSSSLLNPFPPVKPFAPASLPCRLRISQFLILPSHRSGGHGSSLYNTIYKHAIADTLITELTVEDPNEAFDDLRDYNDFIILAPVFSGITVNADPVAPKNSRRFKKVPTSQLIPTERLNTLRKTYKIAPRQFSRLLEMHLLSLIPPEHRGTTTSNATARLTQKHRASNENDRRYYWWRLLCKQRIFLKNLDVLMQVELSDRVEKLDTAVTFSEDGYEMVLEKIVERANIVADSAEADAEGSNGTKERGKRKVILDDEDEDDAESESSKRMKV